MMVIQILLGKCDVRAVDFSTWNVLVIVNGDRVFVQTSFSFFHSYIAARFGTVNNEFLLHLPVEGITVLVEKFKVIFRQSKLFGNLLKFFWYFDSLPLFNILCSFFFLRFWRLNFDFLPFRRFLDRKTQFHRLGIN